MKTMNFEQMEAIQCGINCSPTTNKTIAVISLISTVGSCIPGGVFLFGPLGLGMGMLGAACVF